MMEAKPIPRAPTFAWMVPHLTEVARNLGYAIGLHGSISGIRGLPGFSSGPVANLFAAPEPATPLPVAAATAADDHGWPDRRPIGVIFLSEGGHSFREPGFRTAHNPRGWNPAFHKN